MTDDIHDDLPPDLDGAESALRARLGAAVAAVAGSTSTPAEPPAPRRGTPWLRPPRVWLAVAAVVALVMAGVVVARRPSSGTRVVAGPGPTSAFNFSAIGTLTPEECQPTPRPSASPEDVQARYAVAVAYACGHLDSFSGVWFEGNTVVVAFTNDLAVHQAALDTRLGNGAARVVAGVVPAAVRAKVRADIDALVPTLPSGTVKDWGDGTKQVSVTLRADQATLAADLDRRFGPALAISLGLFRWTPAGPQPPATAVNLCEYHSPKTTKPGLTITVVGPSSVRSGADLQATVHVRNDGAARVRFDTSNPLTAEIRRSGTATVVGMFSGAIGGTGVGVDLAPGQSADLAALGGTASCDAALGYAVPPGQYDLVVPIDIDPAPISYLDSAPSPLTITG